MRDVVYLCGAVIVYGWISIIMLDELIFVKIMVIELSCKRDIFCSVLYIYQVTACISFSYLLWNAYRRVGKRNAYSVGGLVEMNKGNGMAFG